MILKEYQLKPHLFHSNPNYYLMGLNTNPRGKIGTSLTPDPTLKDYLLEFKMLGYNSIILDFIKKLQKIMRKKQR